MNKRNIQNTTRQAKGHPPRRRDRWRRRRARRAMTIAAASLCLVIALGGGALLAISLISRHSAPRAPRVEVAAPLMEISRPAPYSVQTAAPVTGAPAVTDAPAPTDPPHSPTPRPTATQLPVPETPEKPADDRAESVFFQSAAPGAPDADPATNRLLSMTRSYGADLSRTAPPADSADIRMGSSADYARLEGVTTFRGSNYRDGGAYGEIPENPGRMTAVWTKAIGGLDSWSGVGWTGQCSLVRWPADLRAQMNINEGKRDADGLVEVLYATLDGHIYFLDMADGEQTRDAIDIGAPIKGSLTVDPRGVPLLYCGQGIYDVKGKRVPCGIRIWSLIDQKLLYFLDGQDPVALRGWWAFDGSPLVDGESDTMITCGENGVLYRVALNTRQYTGAVTVEPEVARYVYNQTSGGKLGTENSVAVYNHYAYFATNAGIIQCVDLNTLSPVWCVDARDDTDASLVIEPEADGRVALYAVNELDRRGHSGRAQMFKLNALTGETLWVRDSDAIYHEDENGGGGFATPAVGRRGLSGLAYFHICRTKLTGGMIYALDKQTGETVWSRSLERYGWSSPTCLYAPSGKGYVLVGSSDGMLRLLDGLTGEEVASLELDGNIEGTPAVFDDMIVVGTRANRIYGIRIS